MIGQHFKHPVTSNVYRVVAATDKIDFYACFLIAVEQSDGTYSCILNPIGKPVKQHVITSKPIIESNLVQVSVMVQV